MSDRDPAMTLIDALALPSEALTNLRVPKVQLTAHGAPTARDKRQLNEGIEELTWVAALKPTNCGIPKHVTETHEYIEIAVLLAHLRPDAQLPRLYELIHRAIPYPVVLATELEDTATLSLSHKRRSQSDTGRVVIEPPRVSEPIASTSQDAVVESFTASLPLAGQPADNLFTVYDGWLDSVTALQAARLTGEFHRSDAPERGVERRKALDEIDKLGSQLKTLRSKAAKEKQMNRRVELNLEVKRLEGELQEAEAKL